MTDTIKGMSRKEYYQKYYKEHKEKLIAQVKKWQKESIGKKRAYARKYQNKRYREMCGLSSQSKE